MNNLHRELAPVSEVAWADIEAEARRTFSRHLAARRFVDVIGPSGEAQAAVGTGHRQSLDAPAGGVVAHRRESQPIVDLRVPFVIGRQAVDDVSRGAKDADWQAVKDAAKQIAFAEDRAIVNGFAAAGIAGIRDRTSNGRLAIPTDLRDMPTAVAQAQTALRLAGVGGPYSLLLAADIYTALAETTDHGYPIHDHVAHVLGDGEIIWAPAIEGALVVTTRGGDFELHLGQDLSIGYSSHDAARVELYFQESLTFFMHTTEAAVVMTRDVTG
jgi:uncharacterized linocin/CFP29 family protein